MKTTKKLLEIVMCEYMALREETLESIRTNYQILGIGIPVMFGIIGAEATLLDGKQYSLTVLASFFGIFIAISVAGLWESEVSRRIRLALYYRDIMNPRLSNILLNSKTRKLIEIECLKKSSVINGMILGWEEFLRSPEIRSLYPKDVSRIFMGHYNYFRIGALGLIAAACLVSASIGIWSVFIMYQQILIGQLACGTLLAFYAILMVATFWRPGFLRHAWNSVKTESKLSQKK